MPDFLLTDPQGQRFKLTVPEGVSEADIGAFISGEELPGPPQRRSRGDILSEGAGGLKEALAPSYLKDTPPTHESDIALADPAGKPRKIGPPSGPPTAMQMAGGLGADIASQALPELGAAKLAMPALGMAPRQIRSHLDELNEMVRAGRMTPEQLAQARVRLGQPAESPVSRISAATTPGLGQRPVSERTRLDMVHEAEAQSQPPSRPPVQMSFNLDRTASDFERRETSSFPFGRETPPAGRGWHQGTQARTSPLGHYGQEFYNEHLAPHFPDQKAFVQSYFNGAYNGRFDVQGTGGHLYMQGPLVLDGKAFGEVTRIIDPARRTANHDFLEVNDATKGGGFVKQMTANQIDLYRKMGIEQVKLTANIDVGGYAWTQYGWLPPSPQMWRDTALGLGSRFRLLAPDLPPAISAEIQRYLESPDPHAIWALSDIRTPWQHPDWDSKIDTVGKAMLSGQNWKGTLLLNDQRQMARFDRYVSQGK